MNLTLNKLDWVSATTNQKLFVSMLRKAFETTGFLSLVNHGMNLASIARGEHAFREFFTVLPEEQRLQYSYPERGYQIGYTPLKIEKGEFAQESDEKHFYHVYPGDTPFINEIPYFKKDTDELWHEFKKLSVDFMKMVALSIDENVNFFTKSSSDAGDNNLLRGIHYPARPIIGDDQGSVVIGGNAIGMCASPHTDINMVTFLLAKEKGLELWYKNKWMPVTITDPHEIIVNCGDMLQHLTNGIYISGKHRVVCEKDTERFSIPFFSHVSNSFIISPLGQFGKPKTEYHFRTAGEFLRHRLVQIGLLK